MDGRTVQVKRHREAESLATNHVELSHCLHRSRDNVSRLVMLNKLPMEATVF